MGWRERYGAGETVEVLPPRRGGSRRGTAGA